jgi:hypothetical protein
VPNPDLREFYNSYIAALNGRDFDVMHKFIHDEVTLNGKPATRDDILEIQRDEAGAVPDLHWVTTKLIIDGDRLGAQIPGPCRTISSRDYQGVHAIVEDGEVRRITIGEQSEVKLTEGIGTGSSEAAVREAFSGFREEPHKYVQSPAKYLTAPNAEGGDPALRFEIGSDGKVSLIHVGTMPVLGYVEGCA